MGISCNNQDADKTKTTKYRIVDLDHHFNLEPMAGRVMMSTDYSYEDFAGSVNFIRDNEKLTNAEKKAILGENAMSLGFGRIQP